MTKDPQNTSSKKKKIHGDYNQITAIYINENDEIATDKNQILHKITTYYKDLYTSDNIQETDQENVMSLYQQ